jgi:hypothetical protein
MKKLLFILPLLYYSFTSQAQNQPDTLSNKAFGFHFYLPVEFPIIDNSGFRDGLRNANLPDPRHPFASIGLGMQWYLNRSIANISFGLGGRKKEEDAYFSKMDYGSFAFSYGYDLTKSAFFSAYPYLGFKANSLSYEYQEKPPKNTGFDDYLQTDLKYKELYNSRAHLDLGFGLSYQTIALVNARFGYLLPIERSRWYIHDDVELRNAPGANYRYYFSLNIGLGAIYRERDIEQRYDRRRDERIYRQDNGQ